MTSSWPLGVWDNAGSVSPDCRFIAANKAGVILLIPTDGGEPRELTRDGFLAWAPDSQSVLVARRGSTPEIWRVGLDGGSHKLNVDIPTDFATLTINPVLNPIRISSTGQIAYFQVSQNSGKSSTTWVMENFLPAGAVK